MVSRAIAALALLLALGGPSLAQGEPSANRVFATFYQAQGVAQRSIAATVLPNNALGAFKGDPEAPIHIEADRLVEVFDGPKQAVFSGNVKLQQGNILLRTAALTAFYLSQAPLSNGGEWRVGQLTRVEVRDLVLIKSKDGQTATGNWAIFDAMANTVLMGDHVVVSRGKDVAQGPRLKIDLTTGMYRFELDSPAASPPAQMRPR